MRPTIATKYLISHWRGEHGLIWGVLVNGLMGYLLVLAIFVVLDWLFSSNLPILSGVIWLLVFLIWAGVGLMRSAIASLRDKAGAKHHKLIAVGIIFLVGVAFLATTRDSYMVYLSLAG